MGAKMGTRQRISKAASNSRDSTPAYFLLTAIAVMKRFMTAMPVILDGAEIEARSSFLRHAGERSSLSLR